MEQMRAGLVTVPLSELEVRFSRSGGPGGQNVNKRDTRVEVIFDLDASPSLSEASKARARERLGARLVRGQLRVVSSTARTQIDNRRLAIERLGIVLGEAIAPPPKLRRPTRPSRSAREKRLTQKRTRGETKRARRRPEVDA